MSALGNSRLAPMAPKMQALLSAWSTPLKRPLPSTRWPELNHPLHPLPMLWMPQDALCPLHAMPLAWNQLKPVTSNMPVQTGITCDCVSSCLYLHSTCFTSQPLNPDCCCCSSISAAAGVSAAAAWWLHHHLRSNCCPCKVPLIVLKTLAWGDYSTFHLCLPLCK
jgi:hypothetical protein